MLSLEESNGGLLKSSLFLCDCMASRRTRYADGKEPSPLHHEPNGIHLLAFRKCPCRGSFIQTPFVIRLECGFGTCFVWQNRTPSPVYGDS